MAELVELGNLSSSEFDRLQELADRFEEAWRLASEVDLADFVPAEGSPLRPLALRELVKTDMEIRWRRGQGVLLERYLKLYPELNDGDNLVSLLEEEWHVRQRFGDTPALAAYLARFPDKFGKLERRLGKHLTAQCTPSGPLDQTPNPQPLAPAGRTVEGEVLPVGGGYRLIAPLGSGGFGEVWRAEAPGGIQVAIKIIFRPVENKEVNRELEALELIKGLRHQALLQIQAFWPMRDRLLIVMELADGNLRDRLRICVQGGLPGIPTDEVLTYFHEAAEALDHLHRNHVQHRDVKPDNILLVGRHAKLADFGLLRMTESQRAVSVSGSGTPAYMAPEVWRGKGSALSDQYSLAASYAEIRQTRALFPAQHWMQLMMEHLDSEPDLSGLGPREQFVVRKALAKEAEARYPTCLAFALNLEKAVRADAEATAQPSQKDESVPPTHLLPEARPVSVVELEVDEVESGTLALLELAPASVLANVGLLPASSPVITIEPAASLLAPAPAPVWRTAPPKPAAAPRRWVFAVLLLLVVGVAGSAGAWKFGWLRATPPVPDDPQVSRAVPPLDRPGPGPAPVPAPVQNLLELDDDPGLRRQTESPASLAYQRGKQCFEREDWQGALNAFTQALAADPEFAPYYRARGHCYFRLKRYGSAFIDYDKAIKLYPDFAKALANRARIYGLRGEYQGAIDDLNRAIHIEPNQPAYRALRGVFLRMVNRPTEAIDDLTAALAVQLSPVASMNRGLAYADLGQLDKAIRDYSTALQDNPKYAYAHLCRGQAYLTLGQLELALVDFNAAVALDPQLGPALLGRGQVLLALARTDEARTDFVAAMTAGTRDESTLGLACQGLFQVHQATGH